ncbi:MAG: DUF5320 domain-containing protein [Promethearchaeota archaeon]
MPRGDRTGPRGYGPRTGRGLGYCSGFSTPGYTKGPGMGMGWGGGWGRGWGRGGGWGRGRGFYPDPYYYPPDLPPLSPVTVPAWPTALSPEDESKYLDQTLKSMRKEIELIEKRLAELASKKKD